MWCGSRFHKNCLAAHIADCNPVVTASQPSTNKLSQTPDHSPQNSSVRRRHLLNMLGGSNLQSAGSAQNNFRPIELDNLGAPPKLPANWHTLSADNKSTLIMEALLNVQHQNLQIRADLTTVARHIDFLSETLERHDQDILRLSAGHTDMQHSFTDRNSNAEIIISSVPKDLTLSSDELAQRFFTFLGLPAKFYDMYRRSTRFANIKFQSATTNLLIIRIISCELCEEVLTVASQKRRSIRFLRIFMALITKLLYTSIKCNQRMRST